MSTRSLWIPQTKRQCMKCHWLLFLGVGVLGPGRAYFELGFWVLASLIGILSRDPMSTVCFHHKSNIYRKMEKKRPDFLAASSSIPRAQLWWKFRILFAVLSFQWCIQEQIGAKLTKWCYKCILAWAYKNRESGMSIRLKQIKDHTQYTPNARITI